MIKNKKTIRLALASFALIVAPSFALAQESLNGANTAWILTSTALVLFMTLPGLSLFYAGLVRTKNVLSVLMQCFSIAVVISILWFALGYSIAFGPSESAYWGGLSKALFAGINVDSMSGDIPETVFASFQMTFAIITPALIVGAFVERIKFSSMLIFSVLWTLVVYFPVANWVWGGGWLGIFLGLLLFFCRGLNQVILVNALNRRVPSEFRATANSLTSFVFRLAFITTGPLVGYVAEYFSITTAFLMLAAATLCLFVVVMLPLLKKVQTAKLQIAV